MTVTGGRGEDLGRVEQQWGAHMCCWPVREYGVFDETGRKELTVRVPSACADGCANCCAPSMIQAVHESSILDATTRAPVASLQNHWPGCNMRGLCAAGQANNSYRLSFPDDATTGQKTRLVAAAMVRRHATCCMVYC